MRSAIGSLLILAFCSGCATDDTLLGAWERQMKDIGAQNYEVIDSREDLKGGLVFYATWSEDFPGQRDEPSASYYERVDGRWVANPGTVCTQTGITTLGLPDGDFLYCAVLRDDMNVAGSRGIYIRGQNE